MPGPPLTTVALEGDLTAALATLPARPGVGQILGPEGRSLVIGRPANLRRWAASHLGLGRPPRKGKRPPTDLRPVATAVAYALTSSEFNQRLVFERLMSLHVPVTARRDLKPPAYLHLDPEERLPRVTVRGGGDDRGGLFGPFRNRRAALKAIDHLHKLFPLRPCDFVFEPDPALPLGLGCLYAQTRTCAAPCLVRVTEDAYRGLAAQAASFLARPQDRPPDVEEWLPPWVSAEDERRGLVVEATAQADELYPVLEGAVLEEERAQAKVEELESTVRGLRWTPPETPRDDRPWLSAWLHAPKRKGRYLVVIAEDDAGSIAARVRGLVLGDILAAGAKR